MASKRPRPKRRPAPKSIVIELPYSREDYLIGSTILMPFLAENPKTNEPPRMYRFSGQVMSIDGHDKYIVDFVDGTTRKLTRDDVEEHLVSTTRDTPFPGGMHSGDYAQWLQYKRWGRALGDDCIDYAMSHAEEELTFYGADAVIRGVIEGAMERYSEVAHRRGVDEADTTQDHIKMLLEPAAGFKRHESIHTPIEEMIERVEGHLERVKAENLRLKEELASLKQRTTPSQKEEGEGR